MFQYSERSLSDTRSLKGSLVDSMDSSSCCSEEELVALSLAGQSCQRSEGAKCLAPSSGAEFIGQDTCFSPMKLVFMVPER